MELGERMTRCGQGAPVRHEPPGARRPMPRGRVLGGDGLLLVAAGDVDAAGFDGLADRDGQRQHAGLPRVESAGGVGEDDQDAYGESGDG